MIHICKHRNVDGVICLLGDPNPGDKNVVIETEQNIDQTSIMKKNLCKGPLKNVLSM